MGLVDFDLSDAGETFIKVREAITGKRIEDPIERAKLDAELAKIQYMLQTGQIDINKEEAKSPNLFVSGWRPFIGWNCGVALSYTFIIRPLMEWILKLNGVDIPPPVIETELLFNLVFAMLGLAGYRTYEKVKGVSR